MPKVDVIIPFYNTPIPWVQAALQSVFFQTYPDWRLVLINDGSCEAITQEAEALLESCRDRRVVYLKTPNQGVSRARNAGILRSDAPYIAFLDSDDLWDRRKLERQVAVLDRDSQFKLAHSNHKVIDSSGNPICYKLPSKTFLNELNTEQLFKEMLKRNFVVTSTCIIRRDAGVAVGLFDEAFDCMEDKDLWLRLIQYGGKLFYDEEVFAMHRMHRLGISKRIEKMMRARAQFIKKIDQMVQSSSCLDRAEWRRFKRKMSHHMFNEASEGYLDQGHYLKAFKYGLPLYSGFSLESNLLMLRSIYRFFIRIVPW
ncbi:MAG: glycosyltransferase family 2 protein [Candidatus Tectomicrobia bacterium]|nr:glycosyltransferase family 2 protein [Candidatus Tectomicrobia bacterium]